MASQTSFTLTAGSADDNAYDNAAIVITDSVTSEQKAVALVSGYVGATKTITLSADPGVFTMAAGDTVDILANIGSAPTVTQIRSEMDSNSTQLAAIVADTNELQTDNIPGTLATISAYLDTEIAAILLDTGTTLPASLATIAGYIDTEIGTILTNLATAQADLDIITGTDGATLSSASEAAAVVAFWTDTLTSYTNGMAGKRLKGISAVPTDEGTVNDAGATTTVIVTTLTGYADNHFRDALFSIEIAADQWQSRPILSYIGATGEFTLDEELTSAPANGVAVAIHAQHIHPITQIQAGLATEAKQNIIDSIVDAILVKTAQLTFTKANELDSNVQSINGVTLVGDGSATPFDV